MDSKKSGLLEDIWSYIAFTLMLVGIIGISWETFQEDGWLTQVAGAVWDAETRNPLLMTPIVIGAIFLVVLFFRGGFTVGKGNPFSDALVYVLMGAGIYFTYRFFSS